jgi:hypothetical protein
MVSARRVESSSDTRGIFHNEFDAYRRGQPVDQNAAIAAMVTCISASSASTLGSWAQGPMETIYSRRCGCAQSCGTRFVASIPQQQACHGGTL